MTEEQGRQLIQLQQTVVEKLSKNSQKDNWDKLATLSTFLSSIVIGIVGVYFANAYKTQEVRISEMQVVEKFLPILAGTNEDAKKGALLTIATLSDQDLAIRLGVSYVSPGTVEAMEILYETARGEKKNLLRDALIDAYYNRASDNNTKNYDQIISDLNKILKLKSPDELKNKWDGFFLADCYSSLGLANYYIYKYDEAYVDFQKSLGVFPNFYKANWGLGLLFWQRNDLQDSKEKALSYYNLALEKKEDWYVFLYRGQLHREMKHFSDALSDFDQYIIFRPNDSKGYTEKAITYIETSDYNTAKDELKTASKYADDVQKATIERLRKEIDAKISRNKTNDIETVKPKPPTHLPQITSRRSRPKRRF